MEKTYVTRIDYSGPHTIISTTGYSINTTMQFSTEDISDLLKGLESSEPTDDKSGELIMVNIPT